MPAYLYPRKNEEGDWTVKIPEQALLGAKAAAFRPVLVNLPVAIIVFGAFGQSWWRRDAVLLFLRTSRLE